MLLNLPSQYYSILSNILTHTVQLLNQSVSVIISTANVLKNDFVNAGKMWENEPDTGNSLESALVPNAVSVGYTRRDERE